MQGSSGIGMCLDNMPLRSLRSVIHSMKAEAFKSLRHNRP
jgi:hypothetical protein